MNGGKGEICAGNLRRRAESLLQTREEGIAIRRHDNTALIHELQVHQIELELQNEELRHAQAESTRLRQKYEELYDFAPVGYLTLDARGIIREANLTVATLLGIRRERLADLRFVSFLDGSSVPHFRTFLRELAEAIGRRECEVKLMVANGERRDLLLEGMATTSPDGRELQFRITCSDISEQKLRQESANREQNLDSLGMLAGRFAHDFNNILTGILGNISMVRHQALASRMADERLAESEKAAIQARELVRQILTFARGGEPTKVAVDMAPLIRNEVAFVLRDASTTAKLELASDLWHADSDPVQFCSVLNNLLINAIQATTGPETITVRAFNETLEDGNPERLPPGAYVVLQVADQGCGISPEHLARVFDPYFTTKPQGNGLGLASVHAIVRRHGGTVRVTSIRGQGSTFTVRLPAAFPNIETTTPAVEPNAPAGNRRILFMDDENSVREIGRRILSMKGYDVTCCGDGGEAVLLFRSARESGTPFAAVILDLNVTGGMGGIESASRLLELDPEARLIVSSGYASDDAIADFRRFGFSGALPKPFTIEGMAEEVARVLAAGRPDGITP